MGFLDFFRLGSTISTVEEYAKKGAVIIDVRTYDEYVNGHVIGSKNIPLPALRHEIDDIKNWNLPVIVCCQTGLRSAQAAALLNKNGIDCINGGSWKTLNSQLASL